MGSHIPHTGAHRDHLRNVITGKMNLPDRAVPRMDRRVRPFDALAANQVRARYIVIFADEPQNSEQLEAFYGNYY